jgi:hypothetical protein
MNNTTFITYLTNQFAKENPMTVSFATWVEGLDVETIIWFSNQFALEVQS